MDGESSAPRDFEELRAVVVARREDLPKRLSQVAAYALENPDEIAFGTAASIAEAADVQPSTLVRFARQLGFAGFTDMQSVFRDRLKGRASSYQERLTALRGQTGDVPESDIVNGFLQAGADSIANLAQTLDIAAFSGAAQVLARAETIYLIARRRAFPLASYMAYGFGKLGIRAQLPGSAAGIDDEIIAGARPTDAAIAISFTTYTPETVRQARMIAERGVPLISITDSAFSPIADGAVHWFEIAEADFSGFRSLSASMAFCMALTVAVADAR